MTGSAATPTVPSRHCVALKIDVDTLRGTVEGVPPLLAMLRRLEVGATFYFSVGPDHTGRAIKRIFRPGFMRKVRRTHVTSHYGIHTLLYGTLLPGPRIGVRAGHVMRAVRDAGFEVGVHCYDHVRWQDGVVRASRAWTRREFERAITSFADVFGAPPRSHASAGWQINAHVLELEREFELAYASDTRGSGPFYPTQDVIDGECVQIPTTLPTFDELIGVDGRDASAAAAEVARLTRLAPNASHVFTLHAELEGMQLLAAFQRLAQSWLEDGYELIALERLKSRIDPVSIPRHRVELAQVPGRSGVLAVQGARISSGRVSQADVA